MLIRAALCEDSSHDQNDIQLLLYEWSDKSKHQLELTMFEDSTKLSGAIAEAYGAFDVYLLDIEMKAPKEGLALARHIRERSKDIPIIFISSHRELALDSYDVHALHFIPKPVETSLLFPTLERLAELLERRNSTQFIYSAERNTTSVPLHEVIYLSTYEADGHYLCINGNSDTRFLMKLEEAAADYPEDFARCHKSFVVNVSHIRRLGANYLILSDGTELSIGRTYLSEVRARFAEYHRQRRLIL